MPFRAKPPLGLPQFLEEGNRRHSSLDASMGEGEVPANNNQRSPVRESIVNLSAP
jgi:hypothetical protein